MYRTCHDINDEELGDDDESGESGGERGVEDDGRPGIDLGLGKFKMTAIEICARSAYMPRTRRDTVK